jgi:hypothetical protein
LKTLKSTLYAHHGKTAYHHIDIEIDTAGNLVISGVRMPEDPRRLSSDSLSEFAILVSGHHKELVLEALEAESHKVQMSDSAVLENLDRGILWRLGRLYGGRLSGYLEFCKLMASNGIPFKHLNYNS